VKAFAVESVRAMKLITIPDSYGQLPKDEGARQSSTGGIIEALGNVEVVIGGQSRIPKLALRMGPNPDWCSASLPWSKIL